MARRDIRINSKGFILVFVSPYYNKKRKGFILVFVFFFVFDFAFVVSLADTEFSW